MHSRNDIKIQNSKSIISAGTITIPPPTPNNPAIKPAPAAATAKTNNKFINSAVAIVSIRNLLDWLFHYFEQ